MTSQNQTVLRLACSPDKIQLFAELVERFNRSNAAFPQAIGAEVELAVLDTSALVVGDADVVAPETTLWLRRLESDADVELVAGTEMVFAVSPMVIAMWEEVAWSFGYPRSRIGFREIAARAKEQRTFRWGHPSRECATGQLALLAMTAGRLPAGMASAGGISVSPGTEEELAAIQLTVGYYGPSELELIERAAREGRRFLDVFVVQEHLVRRLDGSVPRIVALFPSEGVVWAEHPVALVRRAEHGSEHERVFRHFCSYLQSPDAQLVVSSHGFRPVSPEFADYVEAGRGRANAGFVDTADLPKAQLIEVRASSRDFRAAALALFRDTKRSVNIYILVDVSGSMQGEKIRRVREAIGTFVQRIESLHDRVGLIEFSSDITHAVPCQMLHVNRDVLNEAIVHLQPTPNRTALLDAIDFAYVQLQSMRDDGRINAIVVLTDGLENASNLNESALISRIRNGNENHTPVVAYCIAYGDDADLAALERIASASEGHAYPADIMDITSLYINISRLF